MLTVKLGTTIDKLDQLVWLIGTVSPRLSECAADWRALLNALAHGAAQADIERAFDCLFDTIKAKNACPGGSIFLEAVAGGYKIVVARGNKTLEIGCDPRLYVKLSTYDVVDIHLLTRIGG